MTLGSGTPKRRSRGPDGEWEAPVGCSQPAPDCSEGACTCIGAVCVGTCFDTTNDNANCGGCGITCSGTCTAGRCDLLLGTGGLLTGIAVDAENLYWTEDYFDGDVMKLPLDGGVVSTVAKSPYAGFLAVDLSNLYWVTSTTVVQAPLDGGTPVTLLATGQSQAYGIAVDSQNVYWTTLGASGSSDGSVMSVPIGGGTATQDSSPPSPMSFAGIVVNATNVYWGSSTGEIMTAPLDGGAPTTLASGQGPPSAIALDAANLYWNAQNSIVKLSLDGGPPVTLATGTGGISIALDSSNVYYPNGNGNALVSVPIAGGALTTVANDSYGTPLSVVVDANHVYWTESHDGVYETTRQ